MTEDDDAVLDLLDEEMEEWLTQPVLVVTIKPIGAVILLALWLWRWAR